MIKFDSTGNTCGTNFANCSLGSSQFIKLIDLGGIEQPYAVLQSTTGEYIVAGEITVSGKKDAFFARFDNLGTLIGSIEKFGLPAGDENATGIVETSDGFALSGYTQGSYDAGLEAWLIKTDPYGKTCPIGADGTCVDSSFPQKMFVKKFGKPGLNFNESAFSVKQSLDQGYILSGNTNSFGAGNSDFFVVKTDSFGNTCDYLAGNGKCNVGTSSLQFANIFGGSYKDSALFVEKTSDGGYILSGEQFEISGAQHLWLVKIDSMGQEIWNKPIAQSSSGLEIKQAYDGGYIIAARGFFSSDKYLLIKTDSLGNSQSICCGDAKKIYPEECDDGGQVNGDGCSAACLVERCGNGRIDSGAGETCDDDNIISGDGCSGVCQTESATGVCGDVWEAKFGDTDSEVGFSVEQVFSQESGGVPVGYIVAGTNRRAVSGDDMWLIKTDSGGVSCGSGDAVCADNVGGVDRFVSVFGGNAADEGRVAVPYYSTAGSKLLLGHGFLGNYFTGTNFDLRLIMVDTVGLQLYYKDLGGSKEEKGFGLRQSGANLLAIGSTNTFNSSNNNRDMWYVKAFASGGKFTVCDDATSGPYYPASPSYDCYKNGTWAKRLDGVSGNDVGYSFGSTSFSSVVGSGNNSSGTNTDVFAVLTDSQGGKDSQKQVGGTGFDAPWSSLRSSDGGMVFVGETTSFGAQGTDAWLFKFDSLGNFCPYSGNGNCTGAGQFAQRFGGAGNDYGYSVVQASDGGYIFVGKTGSFGADENVFVVKTDASGQSCSDGSALCTNGSLQFVRVYGGAYPDAGYSIKETKDAAGASTGYVITGSYGNITDSDLWLLKLDRYGNGPGTCGFCGNSVLETGSGEECDDGLAGGNADLCTDGTATGHPDGVLTTACRMTFCGDKIVQALNGRGIVEECDDGMHCASGTACTLDAQCAGSGDQKCIARSGGGCDGVCKAQLSQLKIGKIVLEPKVLAVGTDAGQFLAEIDSTEVGTAKFLITVFDAGPGKEVLANSLEGHSLFLGYQAVDLNPLIDFSLLQEGSYKVEVTVKHETNPNFSDSKQEFFTVSIERSANASAVPEIDLLLLPLVLLAALGLMKWKN